MLSHLLLPALLLIAPEPEALLADNLSLGPACDANETGRLWPQVQVSRTTVVMLFLQPDCVPGEIWGNLVLRDGDVLAYVSRRVLARVHSIDFPEMRRDRQRMRQAKAVRAAVAGVGGNLDAVPPPVEDPEVIEVAHLAGARVGVIRGLADLACETVNKANAGLHEPLGPSAQGRSLNREGLVAVCNLSPVVQILETEADEMTGKRGDPGADARR